MKSPEHVNCADEPFFLPRDQFFSRQTDSRKEDDIVSAEAMPTPGLIESSKDLPVHDSSASVLKFCVRGRAGFAAARDVIPEIRRR